MMKNYIQQIIELFGHNEYSLATRRKVQRWLADDNHAEEKKEALHTLWQQAGEQKVPRGMQQSILRMQQNLGMQSVGSGKKYQLLIWRAAAIFLLAVSSVSIYLMLEKDKLQKDLVECFIPTAEIRELTLPDGTRVMLNSRSTLLYPEQFAGKTRSVYLIGEANFQVKPDEKHPFIVKANDFQITALGTEFNVSAYTEDNNVFTTLITGSVLVEFDDLGKKKLLKPNEQLVYNRKSRQDTLTYPDMKDVTAWQKGELVFNRKTITEIITILERKYDCKFFYNQHSLKNDRYSFRFKDNPPLSEVMDVIVDVAGDLCFKIEHDKCYIMQK